MSVITYKCPNCGGPLAFNAETQNWKCEFCLSDFTNDEAKSFVDENKLKDESINTERSEKEKYDEFATRAKVYTCSSCGAEIVTDDTTAATFCYYCHNPAIIPGQLSGEFRPAKVIPFKFKRDAATEMFIKWCKKKPLLSRKFVSSSQLELLSGIYIPFWLFDCDIRGRITADARNVRTWTTGNKRYTETKYYDVMRAAIASFNGIPADGSKKTDDSLMRIIEPYDYSQMVEFSMPYLSGYLAEKYDMSEKDVYPTIAERIKQYANTLLGNTIKGYTSVYVKNCDIDIHDAKATYVLLPVWMFTYNYKGKTHVFAMNGQTGKIAGSLPLSKSRMAAYFGIISGIVFAIASIGGMFI